MKAISRYRGSHTQAPNFAYALSVRKFKEASRSGDAGAGSLDLSCVRHMINAAEPVDVQAVESFYATYRPFGLPRGVVVPTYGLAEHTVFVCSGGRTVLTLDKQQLELGQAQVLGSREFCASSAPEPSLSSSGSASNESRTTYIVGCGFYEKNESVDVKIVHPETLLALSDNEVCVSSLHAEI